ncbi:hypothetical protein [Microvirga sp. 2TAF3]|uniref:hypothetical protein n=1 Tax=Microvirga sp. 2TAF3 TaxID=3233014 RepID=UPI003F988D2E
MLTILAVLALLALLLVWLAIFLLRFTYRLWRKPQPGRAVRRTIIAIVSLLLVGVPYILVQHYEHQFLLARVPTPLEVASVEYQLEESWGVGFMPGDNETGFVVYRLSDASAEWARNQGSRLGDMLPGSASKWHPTPVGNAGDYKWHPYDHDPQMMSANRAEQHPPTIAEYLEKYGFAIPIEKGRDADADQSIQSEGSFYSYGRGGSVTIIDPIRGKVYFAYAG